MKGIILKELNVVKDYSYYYTVNSWRKGEENKKHL